MGITSAGIGRSEKIDPSQISIVPLSDLADPFLCGSAEGTRADRHPRLPAKQQGKILARDVQAQENVFQDVLPIDDCRNVLTVATVFS